MEAVLPPGIPGLGGSSDPLEAILGPFPCARLRNVPYDAMIEDILQLFQGLVVIDVLLLGRGEAFLVFANPMDFQMALQRNGQTIGRTFVEIGPSCRLDYYQAITQYVLREQDQYRRPTFSAGTSLADELAAVDEQRSAGEAASLASLWGSSPSEARGPSPYGGRFGISFSSDGHGLAAGRGHVGHRGGVLHAPIQKRVGGGLQVGEHTGFLRMRGLPFSASKEDILEFFGDYNPVPESIVLTYRNNDGRATGEAYVGFESPEDSRRAMELHRRMIGQRYIELFISNKEEQGRALARFGDR